MTIFPESKLAHKYLDPLDALGQGIEIGGSFHNPFGMKNCLNVDYTDDMNTDFKKEEIKLCGRCAKVDIVAHADNLPLLDSSQNYIINCHVFEHLADPIRALFEWWRVCKGNAIIYSVVPHRDATEADKARDIVTWDHLLGDYKIGHTSETHPLDPGHGRYGHCHTIDPDMYRIIIENINKLSVKLNGYELFEIIDHLDMCDKVANGFVYVKRVIKRVGEQLPIFYNQVENG